MQLHYHVLKDTCFGIYFQDAFACYGHGSSELIILNHPFQKYSWHGADSAFMCWIVIVANRNIWTVVALNRNMVSMWACIFSFFHLKYKDGTGREVGGGFRMGSTCTPLVDSCWYMAKPIQYCKVINLQLK